MRDDGKFSISEQQQQQQQNTSRGKGEREEWREEYKKVCCIEGGREGVRE